MTIKEIYEVINANYDDLYRRIPSEALIKKFLLKFLDDNSFSSLEENLLNNNYEDAFRSVHTLKGICLNMSFDNLIKPVIELTELLRNPSSNLDLEEVAILNNQIIEQYNLTINSIKNLD